MRHILKVEVEVKVEETIRMHRRGMKDIKNFHGTWRK